MIGAADKPFRAEREEAVLRELCVYVCVCVCVCIKVGYFQPKPDKGPQMWS